MAFAGILRFVIQLHDQGQASVRTLFSGGSYIMRFAALALAFALVFGSCLALLMLLFFKMGIYSFDEIRYGAFALSKTYLLPLAALAAYALVTIFLGYRLIYSWYILADQNTSAVEALKKSWHITRGYVIVLLLITILTSLPSAIVGKIVDYLAQIILYRDSTLALVAAILIQFFTLFVAVYCGIAALFTKMRLYRLLQGRR
jgi:hypothetical protein